MREIIAAAAEQADWLPLPDKLYCGDEIGFDFAGVNVRGRVMFVMYEMRIVMTSPVKCSSRRVAGVGEFLFSHMRGLEFFCEKTGEFSPATDYCIKKAKSLLVDMFAAWYILNLRRDEIHRKFAVFDAFVQDHIAREDERIAPIRVEVRRLSKLSGDAKRRLKAGEISQNEYRLLREPLHKQLSELTGQMQISDPFRACFEEELRYCHCLENPEAFIGSI